MTTTLTKPRTASIIVDTDGDGFKIQHMLFNGDDLTGARSWYVSLLIYKSVAGRVAARRVREIIWLYRNGPTTVFIAISAAKRMTDEQIAAIQAAARETRI